MIHLVELAVWCFGLSFCVVWFAWEFVKTDLLKASILKAADQFGDWAETHGHVDNPLFAQTMRRVATIANFSMNYNAYFFWLMMRRGQIELRTPEELAQRDKATDLEKKANRLMETISGKITTHVLVFSLPGLVLLPVLAGYLVYLKITGRKWSGISPAGIQEMVEHCQPVGIAN